MAGTSEAHQKVLGIAQSIWPWLVTLWILITIVAFFIIRIFGSHSAQRFLDSIKYNHLS
jgi:hypothetical protein